MTYKEAALRINEHMIIHRMKERNAIKITQALEMTIELLLREADKQGGQNND